MRASEADLLIVPGLNGSGPDHWQTRWEAKLPAARLAVQEDWARPNLAAWQERIAGDIERAEKPVILIAHSLGVLASAHAVAALAAAGKGGKLRGGFFVAPPSAVGLSGCEAVDPAFLAPPPGPLGFPALLVASRNDPYAPFPESEALAALLGASLIDAGHSGHINVDSGHGPWPEGLMRFAAFLKML